jgi:hypothetical protein
MSLSFSRLIGVGGTHPQVFVEDPDGQLYSVREVRRQQGSDKTYEGEDVKPGSIILVLANPDPRPPEFYDGRDGSLEQTDADRKFSKGTPWEDA